MTRQEEQHERVDEMLEGEENFTKFLENLPLLTEPGVTEEVPIPKCYFTKNN